MKPTVGNVSRASPVRALTQHRTETGCAEIGWYRGEQSRAHEIVKLLKKWGNVRVSERVRKHFRLNKDGSITL